MENNNWICPACSNANPPESMACSRCECPADATAHDIEQYKKIASNISSFSAPAEPIAVVNIAAKDTERAPYFTASTTKLVLMSLCTLNLYLIYWFYKNWWVIRNYTPGSRLMPVWRSIFSPIWAYSCFREIKNAAYQIDEYKSLSIGYLALAFFALNGCAYLPEPYNVLLGELLFLPIIPVNNMAIAVNRLRDADYKINEEFSTWNKIAVWIGALLWLMILLSIAIEKHHHS